MRRRRSQMKRKALVALVCEHDSSHENYDPSLIRKCQGTDLVECVKCYTLMDEATYA
jgi:hypothetical protein